MVVRHVWSALRGAGVDAGEALHHLNRGHFGNEGSAQNPTPAPAMPLVARTLKVSLEGLFGDEVKPARSRRSLVPQWQEQTEAIATLPRARQRFVTEMLQTVLAQSSH